MPIEDAVADSVAALPGLSSSDRNALAKSRAEEVREVCEKWFEDGEYLNVEIDTDAGTCIVIPVER